MTHTVVPKEHYDLTIIVERSTKSQVDALLRNAKVDRSQGLFNLGHATLGHLREVGSRVEIDIYAGGNVMGPKELGRTLGPLLYSLVNGGYSIRQARGDHFDREDLRIRN